MNTDLDIAELDTLEDVLDQMEPKELLDALRELRLDGAFEFLTTPE